MWRPTELLPHPLECANQAWRLIYLMVSSRATLLLVNSIFDFNVWTDAVGP